VDHRQVPSANANQHIKFKQLPSSIIFQVEGPKIKSGAADLPDAPSRQIFIWSPSISKYLPAYQIL